MKRIMQVFVTRWLSKTPWGMALLGAGWFINRRRRKAREEQDAKLRPARRRQPQRASRR
ncbi:DUF6203 family protein [Herbidospora mongoliensis]|uniref:DUF6203 family protein n=1 Tax=Herbidospora mongoliensis TaxID=688067 RepID=UPI0034E1F039